jgi:F-type H+-transporting ATPase subunit epsilon
VVTTLFELIAPERVMFSGEVRAVMLPATEGGMTDVQGHGHRAFMRGGFVEITELTRDRLDEEILRLETMRDALARRQADFGLSRLEQVRTTLSF